MTIHPLRVLLLALLVAALAFAGGCSGDDGDDGKRGKDGDPGPAGPPGPPGAQAINLAVLTDEQMDNLEIDSEITGVTIASPPVVTFTLTSGGVPIVGMVPYWEDSSRFVRFTITKLVPGADGAPDNWVSYTRDENTNAPDYDTGQSLVDNGDGSYTFTFLTDVANVAGVPYEPTLTHRVAGQMGDRSVPLEPQNWVFDFVPAGGGVTLTRNIATMESCNECHTDLVFHGRRFLVEYCVNCHNPDLAQGEGNMSFMVHRIHSAGTFTVLDDAIDYSYVTYPQDLANCRKCHNADDAATQDGGNWATTPSIAACTGCHSELDPGHGGGGGGDVCLGCHNDTIAPSITTAHLTANATPNNPDLLVGQRNITYELVSADVSQFGDEVTIKFKILSDGTPLDVTNLPADLAGPGRFPGFLLAWALPQGDLEEPMDYNNIGNRGAQPHSVGIGDFAPMETETPVGTVSYDAGSGVNTAVIDDVNVLFPLNATMRAVGLQGYFQQDIGEDTVSLHTPSAVVAVTGDDARREVVDNDNCAKCHEWFEGHGGNRTYNIAICTLCHNPNQSSSGRTVTDPTGRGLDEDLQAALDDGTLDESVDPDDPLTYPEDAQNLKDLVHGIHASHDRTRPFQHVRGGRQGYYDWSHVSFPRGSSTSNCLLCHKPGTFELPLAEGLLPTTVRTTLVADGLDETPELAFQGVPNTNDWVNTPTAGSCFMCHTSSDAMAHMMQNGGLLSDPSLPLGSAYSNRDLVGTTYESCSICHGPGKMADIAVVHQDD